MLNPDASVLGQILAAQNVLSVLPSTQTVAEFYASALASLPGVRWTRVCLGHASAQEGPWASEGCAGCPGLTGQAGPVPASACRLASQAQTYVVAAETIDKRYGYFIVGVDQLEIVEPYRGFIGNLAAFVALHLENREKSALLRRSRDELERRVSERTEQLRSANEQLTAEIDERRRAQEALSRGNRERQAISDFSQTRLRTVDERSLLENVCRIVCEEAGYRLAAVAFADVTVPGAATMRARDGCEAMADFSWTEPVAGGPAAEVLRSGEVVCLQDLEQRDPSAWREAALRAGCRSCISLPLFDETSAPFGVLSIYSEERGTLTPAEVLLFKELAGDLAFGIRDLRHRQEQRRAQEALERSDRLGELLSRIARSFLSEPGDQVYARVLDEVLAAAHCTLGLFGYIAENGDLVIPSFTAGIWDRCQVAGKSTIFPQASWGASLWGRAIREQTSIRSDGPFATPPGHVRIDHFLAVPIVSDDTTIGLIGLADDQRSFSAEDQELLEATARTISPILHVRLQRDWQETRRRAAEDRLRKLSRAVEQSPVSIIITDTSGRIEYVNPKFTEVTGYALAEVQGQNPRLLKSGHTSDEEYAKLWRTITSGREWRGELRNRRKDGELFWEFASISPIFDDSARTITHFVAVKEDITERRRLEEELRQTQKLEAVGQLAGGVAHDFNNMLASMVLGIGALREEPGLSPEVRANLDDLRCETERAAALTRQLLLFSRRETADLKPLDLNVVISNLAKMLRRLIGEDIELVIQAADSGLWVKADAGMAEQILLNLCVNARDAMPDGGPLTISTGRIVVDAEQARVYGVGVGPFVCLTVKDTGCGMDKATLQRIFEPFFTTKEVGKGTGLGLATVYGIVKQHHGWIEVESTPGQGSTFRIFLPALEAGVENPAASTAPSARGGREVILVVEDDRSLRRQVSSHLRRLGYRVLEAASGTEALSLWDTQGSIVDLVLTDMVMPGGLSGLDLVEQLSSRNPRLRAIITSGYDPERTRLEQLAGRGIAFLQKPYDPGLLARTVRACLDRDRV